MTKFTHINQRGQAHMVDVSAKQDTVRTAVAECLVILNEQVLSLIQADQIGKGDLLATARIAGIQAAKRCADMIPLCHPLPLSKVAIDITEYQSDVEFGLSVRATCKTTGKTGVEMEALCAASIAGLTIYDMCKAIDKGFELRSIRLVTKTGGKSGDWHANQCANMGGSTND